MISTAACSVPGSDALRCCGHATGMICWGYLEIAEGLAWLLQMKCVRDKDYIPNFKTAFEHFLVHTGGRAVIEEVEKKLRLEPADVQPSKETLYRYGNTCCAAVFYVLTNMESRVRPSPF